MSKFIRNAESVFSRPAAGSLLLSALLAGCASGTRIEAAQYQQLVEGRTTRSQLVAALGEPTTTSFQGADQVLLYQFSKTDIGSYIPFVNIVASGAAVQQCLFTFGKNEVLKSKMCNEGKA